MIAALALLLMAPQALSSTQNTACTAPAVLPAGMEGWSRPHPIKASATAEAAPLLAVGSAVVARLLPTPKVTYGTRPEHPGGSISNGGILTFEVAEAGRYRVALGSAAWIDVLQGATALPSVAHGHGPACSDIRKMVEFDLQPGRYVLQVAGNGTPSLALMVARLS